MKPPQMLGSDCRNIAPSRSAVLLAAAAAVVCGLIVPDAHAAPTRSTNIALTSDETRVVVANRMANSVSIIQVKNNKGKDISNKIAEIPVGEEPRCVAVHPSDRAAYVANAISGTVSVVDLNRHELVTELTVGTEPRGCALTPDGSFLYVANLTEGTVSIIDTSHPLNPVVSANKVQVGGRPWGIAITDKGTGNISDDTVFVTEFFAELNPNFSDPTFDGNGEARDQGKQGVVQAFPAGNGNPPITKITLSPLANSGFKANRISPNNFCGAAAHSLIFCPDPNNINDPINMADPQGVYPNQLTSGLIRGNRLYLPNIGPQPEPPEMFNVNVQALVYSVDVNALNEVTAEHVNLNNQIKVETAQPPPSLDRTFGNDLVAIDGDAAGDKFLIVSRGGNQIFRATLDASGQLDILNAAKTRVDCRLQTGNLPTGVAMRKDGTRAYADNDVNFSVTSLDTDNCLTLQLDISSSDPPAPGSVEHMSLVGNLAFFTALGIPDNGFQGTDIRDIIPRNFRDKQSRDAWSSCGSCHNDGLSDGVTWIFGTGPRRTIPLDGLFSKQDPEDQRIINWSAIRDSNTDFNNNSRNVQNGCGFASDIFDPGNCFNKVNNSMNTIANPAIYDHGITQGGSDALDAQTLWIFTAVRPLHQPQPAAGSADAAALTRGGEVFGMFCASCHGGAKWTKSQIFHRTNPGAIAQNGAPVDPGVSATANEFKSFTCTGASSSLTFNYLEKIGTFDPADPIEIRDNATAAIALGTDGINPPSLLSINFHAPYLHRGQAQTLADVFPLHGLGPQGTTFPPTTTIANTLTAAQQSDLLVFLKSIDGTTVPPRSEGDDFRDAIRLIGPCP